MRETVKQRLRELRAAPVVNRPATSLARALKGPAPFLVEHLPRHGLVQVDVPRGGSITLRSRGDDWITSRLWWLGLAGFEPETVLPFLRFAETAGVVVDVGAYTGYYSLMAAATNPSARVFAFEPHPGIAARLGENLALNPALSVTVLPYAVSDRRGPVPFHVSGPGLPSSSSLAAGWEGLWETRQVSAVDLVSFKQEWGLPSIDLVKMDVETAEPLVVAGMTGLLASDRPVIVTEVLPGADEGYAAMSDLLRRHDYAFFHLTAQGPVQEDGLTPPAEYVDHLTTLVNHLACPVEKVPSWLAAAAGASPR